MCSIAGSCWFLAALSSLVEYPCLLDKCLLTKCYNPRGMYQFRLCIRGLWRDICVDDCLPCNPFKRLIFAKIKKKQLYAALIEKALAKSHGSYEAISNGTSAEGLQSLTGQPCEVIELSESRSEVEHFAYDCGIKGPELYWQKVTQSKQLGYLLTCICSSTKIKFDMNCLNTLGLYDNHVYSILDSREFWYEDKLVRLVKLRNPWGKKHTSSSHLTRDSYPTS